MNATRSSSSAAPARTPAAASPRRVARRLVVWFARHQRPLPWRVGRDPYRIWVSEIMLQQTTVKAVEPYYRRFTARFPTLERLADAPLERVLAAWAGLGYYRRARHLHAAARLVKRRHQGRLPERREDLLALPGIGRYTAGAILSIAFGRREPVVDGNVARVLARLGAMRGNPRATRYQARLWEQATLLVSSPVPPGDLNQALMELGATVCTPLSPECGACPVASYCAARANGVQEVIPTKPRPARVVRVHQTVALVRRDGRLLLTRRGRTGLLDGLWELPIMPAGALRLELGRRLGTVRHSITFRRLTIDIREARLLARPRGRDHRWFTPRVARSLPASSLLGKILDRTLD